jgi:gas vesicle structural protein
MALERSAGDASKIDVLDRVLDKGIVIDAWMRMSLAVIDLLTVDARITVASIETYMKYSDMLATVPLAAKPDTRRMD